MRNKLNRGRYSNKYETIAKAMILTFVQLLMLFFIFPASVNAGPNIGGPEDSAISIPLITGDTVTAYNISGKVTYSILPDKTGITGNYQMVRSPKGIYFIPDNVDLKKVDFELFNADYLLNEDYSDLDFIPVILTLEPNTEIDRTALIDMGADIVSVNKKAGVAVARLNKEERGAAFNSLLSKKNVVKIWLDKKIHISLSDSVPLIGAPSLWAKGYNGSGIKIAILDTGIDAAHPDLNDIDDNPATNDPKVLVKQDFTDDYNVSDLFGHGTHVASIAAGTGQASGGTYKGVAPGAYLWNLKVLNRYGWGYESWIINGINYAVNGSDGIPGTGDEADIISMSLGGGASDGDDPMSRAVNAAVDAGVVVVIAAGNSGCYFCVSTPGAADKVITVGATDKTDYLAWFSSMGPTLDYRVKPDVAAPGVNIIAARASGTSMGSPVNDLYTSASGTSMATPHVAGTAAILLQKGIPAGWSKPKFIKNVLISSAKDLNLNVYQQGGGRIQVPNASNAQIMADPATVSFRIIKSTNSTVITFTNLNTTSSRTLNLGVEVKDISGGAVSAATLNRSTLVIAPNSKASVLLTVNPSGLPKTVYSGKLTATADNGERTGVIFGFVLLNELRIKKIRMNGADAQNEFIWLYRVNLTSYDDYFMRFVSTNSSGSVVIPVPDGEYNIWSGNFYSENWIWTTKDKLRVTGDTSTTLDERISVPVSFNENKPGQKFAGLFSMLNYYETGTYSSSYSWTLISSYPSNTTTRVTPTSVKVSHSYEYYPAAYYNSSAPWRINTPVWHKLYFSDQGITSPKRYVAIYSNLVKRNAEYKTALVKEPAYRFEWILNKSSYDCMCWATAWMMDIPQKRTEYITPDTYYFGGLGMWNWPDREWDLYSWDYKDYPKGSTPTESWNAQPFSWNHNLERGSNWIYISGYAFLDTNDHIYYSFPRPSNMTLYRDGVKVYNTSTSGYFGYYNWSEPASARYSAVIEGASNQDLAIRSRTVLDFNYTGSGDYKPPKIYLKVPKLDLYNRLSGSSADVNLTIIEEKETGYVNGTPDQLSSLRFHYSINDGATWSPVSLRSLGNGKYSGRITGLPAHRFVSLKAFAGDIAGNNASHTLIRTFQTMSVCNASSIRGYKFNDTSGNGTWDKGEFGLSNWTINLKGFDTCTRTLVSREIRTNATGYFVFSNVNTGVYVLSEEFVMNWLPTTDAAYTLRVPSASSIIRRDFGNKKLTG